MVVLVIIIVVLLTYAGIKYAKKIKEEKESYQGQICRELDLLKQEGNKIKDILETRYFYTYDNLIQELKEIKNKIENMLSIAEGVNRELVRISPKDDVSSILIQQRERYVGYLDYVIDKAEIINKKTLNLPLSIMMDTDNYGRHNQDYYDYISNMSEIDVENYVSYIQTCLKQISIDEISKTDPKNLINCVWYYALKKTFDIKKFNDTIELFKTIYKKYDFVDFWIAEVYAKKRIGGENAVSDLLEDTEHEKKENLFVIASSLMWMQLYKSEYKVLSNMLEEGIDMSSKMQERLHSLSNGGGKVSEGLNNDTRNDKVYFDVSVLAWGNDEYNGLFENLAFQDTKLNYSLAIRDENNELFVVQGINIPNIDKIIEKINSVIQVEYGTGVVAEKKDCIAVSDGEEEKLQGILVYSNECNQMGILVNVVKIGKKVVIKFYTLFMPVASDLTTQKQQALSIYKKLSPSVTMWESSLKDTMLMAIEQLLNSVTDNGGNNVNDRIEQGIKGVTEF